MSVRGIGNCGAYQILSGCPSPTDSEVKRKVLCRGVRKGQVGLHWASLWYLVGEAVTVCADAVHSGQLSIVCNKDTSVGLATVCVGVYGGMVKGEGCEEERCTVGRRGG